MHDLGERATDKDHHPTGQRGHLGSEATETLYCPTLFLDPIGGSPRHGHAIECDLRL
jgi:hypothetical protein